MRCKIVGQRALLGAAFILLAGCAQPSEPSQSSNGGKIPSYIPTDRWYSSTRHLNATIAAADREAVLILGCEKAGDTITLLVSPQRKLPIDYAYRPVTIILDRHVTYIQNWVSLDAGYSIDSTDPGFRTTIEELQKYQEVELALGRPGKDIDDRSFSLNGAKDAIDTILTACGKRW